MDFFTEPGEVMEVKLVDFENRLHGAPICAGAG
jgi:hypothetical protein